MLRNRNSTIQEQKNNLQNIVQYTKGFSVYVYLTWWDCLENLLWIHLYLGEPSVCEFFVHCAFNPLLFGAPPPPSHTQAHSLRIISVSLDIQLTFASPEFWKLPLGRMQIQDHAEQKRDFLLHLPSLEPLVLLFQSLLNSKWGDCCPSDGHGHLHYWACCF